MVLFFTHIPFVVNHTFNATPPERLQHYHQATYYCWSYVVNFIREYFMETDLHLQTSQHQPSLKHEKFTLSYHSYTTLLPQNILQLQLHFSCTLYRDDHYPVCRLDIRQDSEFATGYGYPKTAFEREPDTHIRNAFIGIFKIQTFGKVAHCTIIHLLSSEASFQLSVP